MDLADAVASIEALRSDLNYVLSRPDELQPGLAVEALRRHAPPVTATHLALSLQGQQAASLDLLRAISEGDPFASARARMELAAWDDLASEQPESDDWSAPPPPASPPVSAGPARRSFSWTAGLVVGSIAALATVASYINSIGGPADAEVADWIDAAIGGVINIVIFGGAAGGIVGRSGRTKGPAANPARTGRRWPWVGGVLIVVGCVALLAFAAGRQRPQPDELAVDPLAFEACASIDDFLAELEMGANGRDAATEALRSARQTATRSDAATLAADIGIIWSWLGRAWGGSEVDPTELDAATQRAGAALNRLEGFCGELGGGS